MLNPLKKFVLCLTIAAASSIGLYAQSNKTPEERVKSFYSWYLKSINDEDGPDQTSNKAVMRSHLSARLSKWFYSKAGQALEADYFIQSQEWSEEWADNIVIGKFTTRGTTAVVNLVLGSDGWDTPLRISLVKEAGTWKIDRVAVGTQTAQTTAKRPALPTNLASYVGQYPVKLMKLPSIKSRLKALLGKRYADFDESITVQEEITKQGDFLLASGCMPHSCMDNRAAFVIDQENNRIHAAIFDVDADPQFFNEDKVPTPQILLDWMAER